MSVPSLALCGDVLEEDAAEGPFGVAGWRLTGVGCGAGGTSAPLALVGVAASTDGVGGAAVGVRGCGAGGTPDEALEVEEEEEELVCFLSGGGGGTGNADFGFGFGVERACDVAAETGAGEIVVAVATFGLSFGFGVTAAGVATTFGFGFKRGGAGVRVLLELTGDAAVDATRDAASGLADVAVVDTSSSSSKRFTKARKFKKVSTKRSCTARNTDTTHNKIHMSNGKSISSNTETYWYLTKLNDKTLKQYPAQTTLGGLQGMRSTFRICCFVFAVGRLASVTCNYSIGLGFKP